MKKTRGQKSRATVPLYHNQVDLNLLKDAIRRVCLRQWPQLIMHPSIPTLAGFSTHDSTTIFKSKIDIEAT